MKRKKRSLNIRFTIILLVLCIINSLLILTFLIIKDNNKQLQSTDAAQYEELQMLNGTHMSFQQLTDFFTLLAERKGATYAYDVLRVAELPIDTDFHLLAHTVGDVLYQQEGVDGIQKCTDDFRNACSHSIVIAVFRKEGTGALGKIAKICKEAPGGKGAYTMCFHGLGHGVLAFAEYDMEEAVKLCEKTGTEAYKQREFVECVGGITMEMANGVHDVKKWQEQFPHYFSADNPLSPCDQTFIPELAKGQCYHYLTPHLFNVAGANGGWPNPEHFDTAFSYCERIPSENAISRDGCFGGLGKEFIALVKGRDIRKMEELTPEQLRTVSDWCMLADKYDGIMSCLHSATNSLYWGGENSWNTAVGLCAQTDDMYIESCFDNMFSNVNYYIDSRTYRDDFCRNIPAIFHEKCIAKLL